MLQTMPREVGDVQGQQFTGQSFVQPARDDARGVVAIEHRAKRVQLHDGIRIVLHEGREMLALGFILTSRVC